MKKPVPESAQKTEEHAEGRSCKKAVECKGLGT